MLRTAYSDVENMKNGDVSRYAWAQVASASALSPSMRILGGRDQLLMEATVGGSRVDGRAMMHACR
jgi:hypothetical protein